ncbi:ferredoxin [Streptomyces cylindrosporus]|uniref:Ferredoxin n=1 Tax=Streptomyces cylindrosporus TaxID=2927583 RepID=A0ABS9Y0I1_9ACTN|nr:ferredoxin [Streptomyces cylindrosporus]MCI3270732.1 ferredoxin [Streptomyces cylindrosporus]
MTSVTVDPGRCTAYGICVGIHPEVFAVPPGSPLTVVTRDVLTEDDLEDVREAVRACPAQALRLVEG